MSNERIYLSTAVASFGLIYNAAASAAATTPGDMINDHVMTLTTVVGLIATVVMITRRWTTLETKLETLTKEIRAMRRVLASRPCMKDGKCSFEAEELTEEANEK